MKAWTALIIAYVHKNNSNGNVMKVLVISENIKLLEQISLFPTFKQKGITLTTLRSNLLNASQRIANEVPDIVILDIANAKMNEFELTERFKSQYKNMAFMMMSDDTSAEILLKAIRSGISEVISLPVSEPSLTHAIERHQLKLNTNLSQHSKVISVMSCKGGSGATFIATNLGYILAEAFNKKVLLIVLNQNNERDWGAIFSGIDLSSANDVSLAYNRFKDCDFPYYHDRFFKEACTRVIVGKEAEFVKAISDVAEFDLYRFRNFLDELPDEWRTRLAIKSALADTAKSFCRRYYQKSIL